MNMNPTDKAAPVSLQLRPSAKSHKAPERTNVCFPVAELMRASVPATSALLRRQSCARLPLCLGLKAKSKY